MDFDFYYNQLKGSLKKDKFLYQHCCRVSDLAFKMAKKLKFSEKDTKIIKVGAMLHDIGKLLVPKEILYKKERLTEEEFEQIKEHSTKGLEFIEEVVVTTTCEESIIGIDRTILDIIKYHHKNYDGTGYPTIGENHSEHMTQIITICDCFDAMCDPNRLYKKPLTIKEGIDELQKNSGSQFNPFYVNVLISVLRKDYI